MLRITKLLTILVTCFILLFSSVPLTFAQSEEDLDRQLREKQEEIKKLEGQLEEAKNQEKTLNSQLKIIDSQLKLKQLQIEETKFQIAKLDFQIKELGGRIERISTSLDSISMLLLNRIVSTYKTGNFTPIDLIFSSHGFTDLLQRIKYVQVAQANDKKVLYELQATKNTYNEQKQDKENRQSQQEKLKKDLEQLIIQFEQQKTEKEELLRVTKNNEAKFQELIARLRADAESISRALASKGVRLGEVSKGDRIASIGNSGCSTGPHLHFEVMTPAHVENGIIIGRDNKVDPKPFIDSGKFSKPTSNYNGNDCSNGGSCNIGDITTHFGQVYFLGTHRGLDIADYYGASIYAAEKGTAYATQDSKSCYLTNTVGKGVYIDHGDNFVTLYWHIP